MGGQTGMEKGVLFEDLGERAEFDVVAHVVEVRGLHLLDVGCGTGWLARQLAAAGATVDAFEPDAEQARRNDSATPIPGVRFARAGAQALPVADASVDGVMFHYSLHHVPGEHLHTALQEAHRVLRETGFLYVAEPVPTGSFAHVIELFHDETLVQQSAERALAAHARPRFSRERVFSYTTLSRYEDHSTFVDEMMAPSYVGYTREQLCDARVRARFDGCREGDGFVLRQPVRVNLYQQPLVPR